MEEWNNGIMLIGACGFRVWVSMFCRLLPANENNLDETGKPGY